MQRPQTTLQQLCELFAGFEEAWKDEEAPPENGLVDGIYYEWSHHAVLRAFREHLWCEVRTLSERQVHVLARWINWAVAEGGDLENAVGTCFLEHLPKGPQGKALWSALSPAAKASARA